MDYYWTDYYCVLVYKGKKYYMCTYEECYEKYLELEGKLEDEDN